MIKWLMGLLYRDLTPAVHDGLCDRPGCREHGIIFLDGREILCWDHYAEVCQRARAGK